MDSDRLQNNVETVKVRVRVHSARADRLTASIAEFIEAANAWKRANEAARLCEHSR